MPNNNYARGAAFENKVKVALQVAGWYAVRAAGSHGLTDVIAVPLPWWAVTKPLFIQCKTGKARMGPKDRLMLGEAAEMYGADAYEATLKDGQILWSWLNPHDGYKPYTVTESMYLPIKESNNG